jgi:hypothetical protein
MTDFFYGRTPAQQIATHPALAPSRHALLKFRVSTRERLVGRAI